MAVTADELISGVKRRITMPASQALLTNPDILKIADAIISSRMVPLLESVNQEYFVRVHNEPLVASQSEYPIPYRAIGRGLRELKFRSAPYNVMNLALISLEDAQVYQSSALTVGFHFLGDKIRLVPNVPETVGPDQSLEMYYRLPPSKLVQVTDAMRIVAINGTDLTVSAVPEAYTAGVPIDFIQARSGNGIYLLDVPILGVNGNVISFEAVPPDLIIGDYICLSGYSPVINFIPNECYSLIESYVAQRCCSVVGDFEGAQVIGQTDIPIEEKNMKLILEPRIDGEPTVIINRYSLVRGNKFAQRSWLYGGGVIN